MSNISTRLNDFEDRIKQAERGMSDNKLRLNETSELAGKALAIANDARDVSRISHSGLHK